jgi:hypothetical protein
MQCNANLFGYKRVLELGDSGKRKLSVRRPSPCVVLEEIQETTAMVSNIGLTFSKCRPFETMLHHHRPLRLL